MRRIKLSELPLFESLKGLYVLGTDNANRSVRVSLEWIEAAISKITANAQSVIEEAKKVKKGDPGDKGDPGWLTQIDHGTADTTFTLTPNAMHVWGEVAQLTLTLGTPMPNVMNEYAFEFQSPSTPTSLSLPATLKWYNDYTPTIRAGKRYQASIVNNVIIMGEVSV